MHDARSELRAPSASGDRRPSWATTAAATGPVSSMSASEPSAACATAGTRSASSSGAMGRATHTTTACSMGDRRGSEGARERGREGGSERFMRSVDHALPSSLSPGRRSWCHPRTRSCACDMGFFAPGKLSRNRSRPCSALGRQHRKSSGMAGRASWLGWFLARLSGVVGGAVCGRSRPPNMTHFNEGF